jgi:DNA-binding response OmpR family regulator
MIRDYERVFMHLVTMVSLTQNMEHIIILKSNLCIGGRLTEAIVAKERILVVDDSQDIRTLMCDLILGPRGYVVTSAHDGQEGLKRALEERPDLILLDVNMPRMTGLEVLERLRQAKYEWPVILMTFEGSEEIAVQAFRLGVRDYITKPFEMEEVLISVERVLVESKLRREREELLKRLEVVNKKLNRKVAELTTMYALGQAFTSVLDLDKLFNRVVEASVYLCRSDEGTLYLVDEETGELYMTAAQGVGERVARGLRLRVSDSLVGMVVQTGKPMVISSETASPELKLLTGYLLHSLINVPLKVKDKVIGVLSVANRVRRRSFTKEDQAQLVALANYAAIAIDNARLYEATRKVVAAEVLNHTVVTISHYINNPLMTLMVGVDRLAQAAKDGKISDPTNQIDGLARLTEAKAKEIATVISILREIASPEFVTYMNNIQMLDIEAKVQERLQYIQKKYQE